MFFVGVEDEMALALELSKREGQKSSQKPQIMNGSACHSERHRSTLAHRSFSAAPCYNHVTVVDSEDEEDDEDLQMALACSLSEMEAQQKAGATSFIPGAGGRGRTKFGKHKGEGLGYKVAAEKQGDGGISSGDSIETKQKGTKELATAATTTVPGEEKVKPVAKTSEDRVKSKMCGCVVC